MQSKPDNISNLKQRKRNNLSPHKGKGEKTRKKILQAALKIFSSYSYNAASMRMIGKESGVDHPLISYYFSSKADLMNEVMSQIYGDLENAKDKWFNGLEKKKSTEGFSLFLDRMLSYSLKHPEAFRLFALNMAGDGKPNSSPGYEHITEFLKKIRNIFIKKILMHGTPEEIDIFINSLNAMLINYLGASSYHANLLDLDPESEEYIKWLKKSLMFIFLPRLQKLIHQEKELSGD